MSWHEWQQRFFAAQAKANDLAQREPDPRERRLPMDVANRVRRARRRLSNAYVAQGRAGRDDNEALRAERCLAEAERELRLADELVAELAGQAEGEG